jgi:Ca2+-binding EF-hand superfamily protein
LNFELENTMRKLTLALIAIFATTTVAFAAEMSDSDTNQDGVLSVEEFAAGHAEVDPAAFATIDANADGMIDAAEYEAAKQAGGALAE